jgi:hypothetical protein
MLRMSRWTTLAVIVAAGAALSACGGSSPEPTPSPTGAAPVTAPTSGPAPGAGMLAGITVHRTGGIAGVDEELVVTPAGAWTYTNKKTGATEKGAFTADQGLAIAELASDPGLTQQLTQSTASSDCADGFTYAVDVADTDYAFSDCGQLKPLVASLLKKLTDATPL